MEKDHTKCKHYPWVLIDEDCPNCEEYQFNKASNKFYCIPCRDYTKHREKYSTHYLSCLSCDSLRKCTKLYNPGKNNEPFLLVAPHGEIVPTDRSIGSRCKNCEEVVGKVEYLYAYFHCGIKNINTICVDMNRPLCTKCHLILCNKKIHDLCK